MEGEETLLGAETVDHFRARGTFYCHEGSRRAALLPVRGRPSFCCVSGVNCAVLRIAAGYLALIGRTPSDEASSPSWGSKCLSHVSARPPQDASFMDT